MLLPERDCSTCKKQEEWGCEAKKIGDSGDVEKDWINPSYIPMHINGEDVYVCPRRPILEHPDKWEQLSTYYAMYQKGFLPNKGGIAQQNKKLIDIFRIIDGVVKECEEALRQKPQKHTTTG